MISQKQMSRGSQMSITFSEILPDVERWLPPSYKYWVTVLTKKGRKYLLLNSVFLPNKRAMAHLPIIHQSLESAASIYIYLYIYI